MLIPKRPILLIRTVRKARLVGPLPLYPTICAIQPTPPSILRPEDARQTRREHNASSIRTRQRLDRGQIARCFFGREKEGPDYVAGCIEDEVDAVHGRAFRVACVLWVC